MSDSYKHRTAVLGLRAGPFGAVRILFALFALVQQLFVAHGLATKFPHRLSPNIASSG